MDPLYRQIRRARRRLMLQRMVTLVPWTTAAALVVVLAAILAPKFGTVDMVQGRAGALAWGCGALMVGLLAGVAVVWVRCGSDLDAALEIDARFGLKERVSSAYAMYADQRGTPAGRALWEDARQRVAVLDISERFPLQLSRWTALPLAMILFLAALTRFVPDAGGVPVAAADPVVGEQHLQVRHAVEQLRRRLNAQQQAAPSGHEESGMVVTRVRKAVDDLVDQDRDRKQTLVQLNNLTQELAQRRMGIEASQEMRDLLQRMSTSRQGPADRVMKALRQGDMRSVQNELRQMSRQLENDQLSTEQVQQLNSQLQELGGEVQKLAASRAELSAKERQLRQHMEQLRRDGRLVDAGALQRRLDELQKQLDALDRRQTEMGTLQELADQFEESARALQEQATEQAAAQLDQIAHRFEQWQRETQEQAMIDSVMREIAAAKNSMHCEQCGGRGCALCRGGENDTLWEGDTNSESDALQRSAAAGRVPGQQPHEELESSGPRSSIAADPGAGPATRAGDAVGLNTVGTSRAQVREEIAGAFNEDPAAVTHQQLPRREREQAREYFELLRQAQ